MSTILVVTASPRGDRSVSRTLTTAFLDLWTQRHPGDRILLRDVGHHPVPHVTEPWVVGAFAPMDQQTPESKAAIAVSDQLVEEFLSADRFIFGVPMYNFNIPSTFKAYIDQIVRAGRTFAVGPNGYEGLVKGKKALFITSSGGAYLPGSAHGRVQLPGAVPAHHLRLHGPDRRPVLHGRQPEPGRGRRAAVQGAGRDRPARVGRDLVAGVAYFASGACIFR